MDTVNTGKLSLRNKILGVTLLVFGAAWLFASAISWSNEFAFDPPVLLGTARVVRLDSDPPYNKSKRPSFVMRYPVFEYFDTRQAKRELNGKGCFNGYFEIGDEVQIGQTKNGVVILDAWFRSHDYIWSVFLASLAIAFGWLVLCINGTKKALAN